MKQWQNRKTLLKLADRTQKLDISESREPHQKQKWAILAITTVADDKSAPEVPPALQTLGNQIIHSKSSLEAFSNTLQDSSTHQWWQVQRGKLENHSKPLGKSPVLTQR